MAVTKTIDERGRLNLGKRFANRHVIIDKVDESEIRVRLARVVPEREAWLLDNAEARESIERGLNEAKDGKFAEPPPDLESDLDFCEEIEDDHEE